MGLPGLPRSSFANGVSLLACRTFGSKSAPPTHNQGIARWQHLSQRGRPTVPDSKFPTRHHSRRGLPSLVGKRKEAEPRFRGGGTRNETNRVRHSCCRARFAFFRRRFSEDEGKTPRGRLVLPPATRTTRFRHGDIVPYFATPGSGCGAGATSTLPGGAVITGVPSMGIAPFWLLKDAQNSFSRLTQRPSVGLE